MVGRFRRDYSTTTNINYVLAAGDPVAGFDFAGIRFGNSIQGVHYINGVSALVTGDATANLTWYDGYTEWNAAVTGVRLSAGALTTGPRNYPITGNVTGKNIMVGQLSNGLQTAGMVGPVAIFDRPLTQAELTLLQNTEPSAWWTALA